MTLTSHLAALKTLIEITNTHLGGAVHDPVPEEWRPLRSVVRRPRLSKRVRRARAFGDDRRNLRRDMGQAREGLYRNSLFLAGKDQHTYALAQRDLEAARLLDLGEVERAKLLLDASPVVRDQGVRDVQTRGCFELRDVRRAEVTIPQDAEHAVVLFALAAHRRVQALQEVVNVVGRLVLRLAAQE